MQDSAGLEEEGPVNRLGTRVTKLERAVGELPEKCRECGHVGALMTLAEWCTGRRCHCGSCGCGEFSARAFQRRVAAEATLAEFEEVGA